MGDKSSESSHPAKKRGIFGRTIDLIFKIIGILLFSAIVSVMIEWCGIYFFYPELGYHHAEDMMQREMGYLSASLKADISNKDAVEAAGQWIDNLIAFLFVDSGLIESLTNSTVNSSDDGVIVGTAKKIVAQLYNYLMAAVYIIIVFITRFSILVLSIPAFLLFGIVGICDGLMQRDLRRWCGGNESGFVYHWAKSFSVPVLVLAWVLYLAIPSSIHPNMIITPFAVIFGTVLMVMSSKFKKYL